MTRQYDDLLATLDLAARVRLLTAASFFSVTGDDSIGLAPLGMSDGPSGVKGQSQSGGEPTSLLPNATLLASTWSEQTLTEVGTFLAQEANRSRTHIVLGPTFNLHRSPLGGRVFEAFSEDPLLTGKLAAAYVRGCKISVWQRVSSTWWATRRRPTGTRSMSGSTRRLCARCTCCRSRSRSSVRDDHHQYDRRARPFAGHRRGPGRSLVGSRANPRCSRDRPRPGLGRRRHLLPHLGGIRSSWHRRDFAGCAGPGHRRSVVRSKPALAGHRRPTSRGTTPLPNRRPLVPADRRGRHRGRTRSHHRPRPVALGSVRTVPEQSFITARGTDAPVQNTGHADLVQRPDGSWAMVHLGVRPRGTSPRWHVLGRETFGVEIIWDGGWPCIGAAIEPISAATDLTVDSLEGSSLQQVWVSPARFPSDVLRSLDGSWLLTAAVEDPAAEDLSFVGRRQEHLYLRTEVAVRADNAIGGLSVRIDGRHHLDLEVQGNRVQAVAQIGEIRSVLGGLTVDAGADVRLQLHMEPARGSAFSTRLGPDLLLIGVLGGEHFVELGRLDGRYLSTELAGGFTGRMIGIYCRLGTLELRSFEYRGADDPEALPGGCPI